MRTLKLQPRRRQVAATTTIALTTAFIAFVMLAVGFLGQAVNAQTEDSVRGLDLRVTAPANEDGTQQLVDIPHLASMTGVKAAFSAPEFATLSMDVGKDESAFAIYTVARPGVDYKLFEGALPKGERDVVIDNGMAKTYDLGVGDTLTVKGLQGEPQKLTITGIRQAPMWQLFQSYPELVLSEASAQTAENAAALPPEATGLIESVGGIQLAPGADEEALIAQLKADGYTVTTDDQIRKDGKQVALAAMVGMGSLLTAFILIAVVTSVLVVSNSFAVTMAQRRRSFALARALGATRGQAVAAVVRDALLVGVVGVIAGVLLAYLGYWGLLAWGHAGFSPAVPSTPDLNILAIVIPALVGLFLALAASLAPALAVLKVKPLEAMRPVEAYTKTLLPLWRIIAAGLSLAAGVALTTLALFLAETVKSSETMLPMLAGIGGGVFVLLGFLMLLPALVRPLARLFAAVTGPLGGTPARFAAVNASRHPRRTATTVSALVIGATLMSMMSTGAATAERSIVGDLTARKPMDSLVVAQKIPDDVLTQLAKVEGVEKAVALEAKDVTLPGHDAPMTILAGDPGVLNEVSHKEGLGNDARDNTLVMGTSRAKKFGVSDGDALQLRGADGKPRTIAVKVEGNLDLTLTTRGTLKALEGAPLEAAAVRLADPGSPKRSTLSAAAITEKIMHITKTINPDTMVMESHEGGMREMYAKIISTMLISTFVLLGIAVLVALVGVANTLSLSVVERSGENALLRALGTSRVQIQAMLAWEGAFIALTGAALGIVLGAVFGVIGVRTLVPKEVYFQMEIPWAMLAAVLGLALLAGLLASVIPGRVASRVQPAAALAQRDE